jgi:hypothetical protein
MIVDGDTFDETPIVVANRTTFDAAHASAKGPVAKKEPA